MTALEFRIDWEPVDQSVLAPGLRATWSHLEIRVGGTCITSVEDVSLGSVRRSISVPVYPIAEWVAFNWWPLRFNGRRGGLSGRVDRRNVRSAGDGFIWPDLELLPTGAITEVRWGAAPSLQGDAIRYLSNGRHWVSTSGLQTALGRLVESVMLRLQEHGITHTSLQEEWERLRGLDGEEATFCEAAARLGLEPFSEGLDHADSIAHAFQRLTPAVHGDFFDAVPPDAMEEVLDWIDRSLALAQGVAAESPSPRFGLRSVTEFVQQRVPASGGTPPWVIGYAVARTVRRMLELSSLDPMTEDIPVRTRVAPAVVPGLSGVGTTTPDTDWTNLVVRTRSHEAARFAAARALWHAALAEVPSPYLLTSSSSTSQRIGRAFAAELIAPAEGIRTFLDLDGTDAAAEDIHRAARHFGASDAVITYQIENQLLQPVF